MKIKFGVAGFPPNFWKSEYKNKRERIFEWLAELGLDWIELQNTYGVKMPLSQASTYRTLADKFGIGISIHAPYYISFASRKADVVERSKMRMIQCFQLAQHLGAERIIFHPGYPPGKLESDRLRGLDQIIEALLSLENQVPDGVYVYPETAGKNNQIGSLDETLEICSNVKYARPCLDMAHIHAFTGGSLTSSIEIRKVFERTINTMGPSILEKLHIHMYPVEYDQNGEKKHKAFDDIADDENAVPFFPKAEDFISVVSKLPLDTVVICEARDTQDVGAMLMKQLLYGE